MSKRDGQMGAGLESGTHMKEKMGNTEKLLGKPLPPKGTPPWPKGGIKGGDGKYKFK